ncbi:DEAD/DEAH box helicase family protein [Corynebacterium sp. UBA2622]|uniref:DEAD/DEAH box helicase family protein n=1 Tax=Corynebacterium sp. UBA2622 TaxID=1946393 RepID=UPI0025BD02A2|nr:DEAD/DEAH box helicase family protein [Corynebacterium sp. UBA2622]
MADIIAAPVNWDVVFPGSEIDVNLTRKQALAPRKHQVEAVEKALSGYRTHDRGKLIMVCGTGETFTALRLAEHFRRGAPRQGPGACLCALDLLVPSCQHNVAILLRHIRHKSETPD